MPIAAQRETMVGATRDKEEQGEGTSCQMWEFRDGFLEEVVFMLSLEG